MNFLLEENKKMFNNSYPLNIQQHYSNFNKLRILIYIFRQLDMLFLTIFSFNSLFILML